MVITQKYVNDIAYEIVGCAIEVHKELGPGLLESIYEKCLVEELLAQGFKVESQSLVPLKYKGKDLGFNFKMDIVVEDLIVVELKSVESILPVFKAQLLTYLKLANKPKGLLINFNSENITKDGLVPLVTKAFSNLPK
ncbi:MAG: GxxExxY protein [Bacteroidetes bacterium]|nr:GxxExxY protein [Bacteroidota bacterium]